MIRAIADYEITGVETTLGFCNFVMHHPAFRSGQFSTKFVEQHFKPEYLKGAPTNAEDRIIAALAVELMSSTPLPAGPATVSPRESKWKKNRL